MAEATEVETRHSDIQTNVQTQVQTDIQADERIFFCFF